MRDAVAMLALAERAEEVAGAAVAEELAAALEASAAELDAGGYAAVAAAARGAAARAVALDRVAQGPRVATPAYLDRLAATALELGAALAVYETELSSVGSDEAAGGALPEHLHDAWRAAALARSAGSPARAAGAAGGHHRRRRGAGGRCRRALPRPARMISPCASSTA